MCLSLATARAISRSRLAKAQALGDLDGPVFTPYEFGAVGNGSTDDSAALVAATEHARVQGGVVTIPPGRFLLSRYLEVRQGVRGVVGAGGIIQLNAARGDVGILVDSVRDLGEGRTFLISGLTIDCGDEESASTNAIVLNDCSGCEVSDNYVFNLVRGYGVLVRALTKSTEVLTIARNLIAPVPRESPNCSGIAIHGSTSAEIMAKAYDVWRLKFALPRPRYSASKIVVANNTVLGGYYGISLSGASECSLRGNLLRENVRNISIQHRSDSNIVDQNDCFDSTSSAIHLAYGSSENRVAFNRIVTARACGEGLLQAYVGTRNNVFLENSIAVLGEALPKYHVYVAVHANGNRIEGNRLGGACGRAYIAVESAFSSKVRRTEHRNFGLSADLDGFARSGTHGVVLTGNSISATSNVPCVFLAQVSDAWGVHALRGCELVQNRLRATGDSPAVVLAESTEGALCGVLCRNNLWLGGGRGMISAPRGIEHFSTFTGNKSFRIDR
ncbi:MAG: hypothetical protein RL385_624 [Pseudomonadota bacterium]